MSRKLDVAIAEALGYETALRPLGHLAKRKKGPWEPLPYYPTDGNAMLELDAEMRERGWLLEFWWGTKKTCWAGYRKQDDDHEYHGTAVAMPLAVALAAYKALTGKNWEEGEQE